MPETTRSLALSLGIIAIATGIAYAPTPQSEQSIIVVSGSELQEPLTQLEEQFEATNPTIDVELKFQGSRDIVNRYLDDQNDFTPTVLIPANGVPVDGGLCREDGGDGSNNRSRRPDESGG